MKRFQLSAVSSFVLAASACGQIRPAGSVPTGKPETYGAAMIGVPLAPPNRRTFPIGDGPTLAFFAVQPVRVVNSLAFPPGTVVDVYLPFGSMGRRWSSAPTPSTPRARCRSAATC